MRASQFHGALVLVLTMGGCARFGEAFNDRIAERAPTIALACRMFPVAAATRGRSAPVIAGDQPIFNGVEPLFDWPAVPSTVIRVVVLPERPNDVLVRDLTAMLGAPDPARPAWIVGFTYLVVESIPAKWSEIKGTIRARVAFDVDQLPAASVRRFHGEHEVRVAYFYSSDMELALQAAYCEALSKFAQCIDNESCGEVSP